MEISIQEIRPVLSNALVVGSSPSESEEILNKYLELDIQAKVIKVIIRTIMLYIII